MSDPEDIRVKLNDKIRDELTKSRLSNAENYDKALLTYSTAGLGFSLAFLKDFIPIGLSTAPWLLYLSWAFFVACILSTMCSYVVSQFGIKKQLNLAERYYLHQDDTALEEKNHLINATDWLNVFSGILFAVAVITTTLFVSLNLKKASTMSENKRAIAQDGAPVSQLQKVPSTPLERGAPISNLQKVPQSQPQPKQNGNSGASGNK